MKRTTRKQLHKIAKTGLAVLIVAVMFAGCGGGGGTTPSSNMGDPGLTLLDAPEANQAIRAMAAGAAFDTDITEAEAMDEDLMVEKAFAADDTIQERSGAGRTAECRKKDEIPTGASGGPSVNDFYTPDKAFDGDYNTWWAGKVKAKFWNLYYGFENVHYIEKVNLNFYNIDYTPRLIMVLTSTDGRRWRMQGLTLRHRYEPDIAVGADAKYIWITMLGNPRSGFPLVRDIAWDPFVEKAGAFAEPNAKPDYNLASDAMDGDMDTYWAGAANAGEWTFIYNYKAPRKLGRLTVHMMNPNYIPPQMNLAVSNDGENWEDAGELSGYFPSIFAGRDAQYFRLTMSGIPGSTFPLIQEITNEFPEGAEGGPNEKPSSWPPANAFDGDLNTWWVGQQNAGAWDLFYTFDAPRALDTVTVHYYAASHAPAATTLYTSNDGLNWTLAGELTGATGDKTLAAAARAKHLWFKMEGNPQVGYPLVKDISF